MQGQSLPQKKEAILQQGWQTFSVNDQIVNISCFTVTITQTQPSQTEKIQRQYVNERVWLCSREILFVGAEIKILYSFYITKYSSSWQVGSQVQPVSHICSPLLCRVSFFGFLFPLSLGGSQDHLPVTLELQQAVKTLLLLSFQPQLLLLYITHWAAKQASQLFIEHLLNSRTLLRAFHLNEV